MQGKPEAACGNCVIEVAEFVTSPRTRQTSHTNAAVTSRQTPLIKHSKPFTAAAAGTAVAVKLSRSPDAQMAKAAVLLAMLAVGLVAGPVAARDPFQRSLKGYSYPKGKCSPDFRTE